MGYVDNIKKKLSEICRYHLYSGMNRRPMSGAQLDSVSYACICCCEKRNLNSFKLLISY
jgi:hypothetical protein